MSLARSGRRYGIGQYRYPRSFQLAGDRFTVVSADGSSGVLEFLDRERLTWAVDGAEAELSYYECIPVAEDVYFVSFEIAPRFAVVDLARGQLFLVDVATDEAVVFAIDGLRSADEIDAGVTDEMTGTSVTWTFGDARYLKIEHLSAAQSRQSWSPRDDRLHVRPTTALRIADGLYLVLAHTAAPPGIDLPQGLNRLVMVQDFERVVTVGAATSVVFNERILFSGYGAFA